ncbi:MAG: hypothetical protein ACFCUR_08170 [Rhodomicrobiaceae bacterium]
MQKIRRPIRCGDPVEIPFSARVVKARYSQRPSEAVVQEILDYVREMQTPHLWHGHTHTKPPANARVVYLGEFELTENTAAPCPCCTPDHAKYFASGRIGWFPDEAVIRLTGWKCFRRLSPDAYDVAEEEYDKEKQRKADEHYILVNIDKVRAAINAIDSNLEIAEAVDRFAERLNTIVYKTYDMNLWRYIRDGELRVEDRGSFPRIATLRGYLILKEPKKSVATQLTNARTVLEGLDDRVLAGQLEHLTDTERTHTCDIIGKGFAEARAAVERIEDFRQFADVKTASTLRTWGKHQGCPCQIYARREGPIFRIGKTEDRTQSIVLPTILEGSLARIPELGVRSQGPRRRRRSAKSEAA